MIKSYLLNQPLNIQSARQARIFRTVAKPISLPETPLFGTDGIRGCVGTDKLLNASLALKIGFWAGQVLQQQSDSPYPHHSWSRFKKL